MDALDEEEWLRNRRRKVVEQYQDYMASVATVDKNNQIGNLAGRSAEKIGSVDSKELRLYQDRIESTREDQLHKDRLHDEQLHEERLQDNYKKNKASSIK